MNTRLLPLILLSSLFVVSGASMVWFKLNVYEGQKLKVATKDPYCNTEKQIAVVVNGNSPDVKERIRRVLSQKYSHFTLYLVSDHKEDLLYGLERKHLVRFVEQGGAPFEQHMHTLVHSLPDNTLVLVLNGNEAPAHKETLAALNKYYSNSDTWCTYGSAKGGHAGPYTKNELYSEDCTLHKVGPALSFLASAYKQIPLENITSGFTFKEKQYIPALLGVAKDHVYYIDAELFVGRAYDELAHVKPLDIRAGALVKDASCDLVVFSYNRPLQLRGLLDSSGKHLHGLGKTFVLYRADETFAKGYETLQREFPAVTFVKQSSENPKNDFKRKVMDLVFSGAYSRSTHILFAVDDIIVQKDVDIPLAVAALEKTHAHGVFLRLGKNIDYCYMHDKKSQVPEMQPLEAGLYGYAISDSEYDWAYPNTVDMSIYNKHDLRSDFETLHFTNPSQLESEWAAKGKKRDLGLVFEQSKIVNIPLNVVAKEFSNRHMGEYTPEELLEFFNKGYRIDTTAIEKVPVQSCHAEIDLEFVHE